MTFDPNFRIDPPPAPSGPVYGPLDNPPARRAGLVLFAVAAFGLLCGFGSTVAAYLPIEQAVQQAGVGGMIHPPPGVSLGTFLHWLYLAMGIVLMACGFAFLGVAPFVRAGRRGAILTAIVLCLIAAIYFGLNLVGSFVMLLGQPGEGPFVGVLVSMVGLGVFVTATVWLLQGKRVAETRVGISSLEVRGLAGSGDLLGAVGLRPPPAPPGTGSFEGGSGGG